MDTLPSEIHEEIFRLIADGQPPKSWAGAITSVSRRWRSLSLSYPALWTHIDTHLCSPDRLSEQIALSGCRPIQLSFHGYRLADYSKIAQALLPECYRIHTLRFDPVNDNRLVLSHRDPDISTPEQLYLVFEVILLSLLRKCTSLQSLSILGIEVSWNEVASLIRCLRHLRLNLLDEIPLTHCLDVLSQCPQLEELSLEHCSPTDHDWPIAAPRRTISLAKLRTLRISRYPCCVSWFCDHLVVPETTRLFQESTIDVCLDDHDFTKSVPKHNRDRWPIYTQVRRVRLRMPDEYHFVLEASVTDKHEPNELEGPSLEITLLKYDLEWKIQHLLVAVLPDIADVFSAAPVTHLVVDAKELVDGLRFGDQNSLDGVHFTSATWSTTLTRLPLLEYLELRERDIVKPLFEALGAAGENGDVLCPGLRTVVLAMPTFDEETVTCITESCAFRVVRGRRLVRLTLEGLGCGGTHEVSVRDLPWLRSTVELLEVN